MRWKKASLYPAVCSRPPWAPRWCLPCGALGWKALQHLPLLSGSVQGKIQSTLFGRGKEKTRQWERVRVREKKKRVMICITICKNPQCIRPSRTNTGFCSGSALASCSWHFPFIFFLFHWSGGPAVCLFIFENNSPLVFWFGVTRRALQRDRFGSFSSCLTYHGQLHRQESEFIPQSQSAGSFTHLQLHTQRGQSSLSYFLPRLSLRLWLEFVIEGETLS